MGHILLKLSNWIDVIDCTQTKILPKYPSSLPWTSNWGPFFTKRCLPLHIHHPLQKYFFCNFGEREKYLFYQTKNLFSIFHFCCDRQVDVFENRLHVDAVHVYCKKHICLETNPLSFLKEVFFKEPSLCIHDIHKESFIFDYFYGHFGLNLISLTLNLALRLKIVEKLRTSLKDYPRYFCGCFGRNYPWNVFLQSFVFYIMF